MQAQIIYILVDVGDIGSTSWK